jgi:hypothetical protein
MGMQGEGVQVRTTPRGITLRAATPRESLLVLDPAGRLVYAYLAPAGWWFHLDGRAVLRSHREGRRVVRHLSFSATRRLVESLGRMWAPQVPSVDLSGPCACWRRIAACTPPCTGHCPFSLRISTVRWCCS